MQDKEKSSLKYFIILIILSGLLFLGSKLRVLGGIIDGIDKISIPVQKNIYLFWLNAGKNTSFLSYWKNGDQKIRNLEERNRELLVKALKTDNLEKENTLLKEQLQIDSGIRRKYIPAYVISGSSGLKIDKGKNDGIKAGMAAVYKEYLVGIVREVNSSSALIEIPSDSHFRIEATTANTRAKGIVKGQFDNEILFDNVLQKEDLRIGDILVTTGEIDMVPRDLIVGKIKEIIKKESDVFQKATVEQLFNQRNISEVFIIKE